MQVDRKVPSEVVLMGSLCLSDMVMSDKTDIVEVKKAVEL